MGLIAACGELASGCAERSTLNFTCKVPMEAKSSSGTIAVIGSCSGLLGSEVAHISLKRGQSVAFSLLQKVGLGPTSLINSDPSVLEPIAGNGSLAVFIARQRGTARVVAVSAACRADHGIKDVSRCLIAIVRVP